MSALDPSLLLFVPGDRPDRFAKALASAATGAILDCEDAVAPANKAAARAHVLGFLNETADLTRVAVRINPPTADEGRDDLAMLARARRPAALVVPKAIDPDQLDRISAALDGIAIIALIETAIGIARCDAVACARSVIALAFGPYDLAAELGGESARDVMLPHRARMLVGARASGRWAIDGPSREYGDPAIPADDALHARRLGFDGKLLIHPAQLAPVRAAFAPSADELAYAKRIVDAAQRGSPAVLDGTMIDTPIVTAAQRTVARAAAFA
jgi:citrate lyase subunit beta/citryl-CoA lyase